MADSQNEELVVEMKKFFLALVGAATLIGSVPVYPDLAQANHVRRHVCRVMMERRVVWRHGRRYVVRERVRRCVWI